MSGRVETKLNSLAGRIRTTARGAHLFRVEARHWAALCRERGGLRCLGRSGSRCRFRSCGRTCRPGRRSTPGRTWVGGLRGWYAGSGCGHVRYRRAGFGTAPQLRSSPRCGARIWPVTTASSRPQQRRIGCGSLPTPGCISRSGCRGVAARRPSIETIRK